MTITFSNLGASANPDIGSATDASSYANSSWTPPSSGLIYVWVWSRASTLPNTPTISGNSLTWVEIATVTLSSVIRLTLFGANASGSSTGATTIDFGGQTQQGCTALFSSATGVDLSGGVAAAFVQTPSNTNTAVTTLSITLSAAGHADNRPIACFGHNNENATTPRTNWTEEDDISTAGPGRNVESQNRADAFETTASADWTTNSNVLGMAAELKAEIAGGTTILPQMMAHEGA